MNLNNLKIGQSLVLASHEAERIEDRIYKLSRIAKLDEDAYSSRPEAEDVYFVMDGREQPLSHGYNQIEIARKARTLLDKGADPLELDDDINDYFDFRWKPYRWKREGWKNPDELEKEIESSSQLDFGARELQAILKFMKADEVKQFLEDTEGDSLEDKATTLFDRYMSLGEWKFLEGYSGRGMYGAKSKLAFECKRMGDDERAAISALLGVYLKMDNMGLEYVYYTGA